MSQYSLCACREKILPPVAKKMAEKTVTARPILSSDVRYCGELDYRHPGPLFMYRLLSPLSLCRGSLHRNQHWLIHAHVCARIMETVYNGAEMLVMWANELGSGDKNYDEQQKVSSVGLELGSECMPSDDFLVGSPHSPQLPSRTSVDESGRLKARSPPRDHFGSRPIRTITPGFPGCV
jgi:hypothetical protein